MDGINQIARSKRCFGYKPIYREYVKTGGTQEVMEALPQANLKYHK